MCADFSDWHPMSKNTSHNMFVLFTIMSLTPLTFKTECCNALSLSFYCVWCRGLDLFQLQVSKHMENVTPAFYGQHLLPIQLWVQFKVLTLIFKAPHCLEVSYSRYHISLYASSWQLKSAAELASQNPQWIVGSLGVDHFLKKNFPKNPLFLWMIKTIFKVYGFGLECLVIYL